MELPDVDQAWTQALQAIVPPLRRAFFTGARATLLPVGDGLRLIVAIPFQLGIDRLEEHRAELEGYLGRQWGAEVTIEPLLDAGLRPPPEEVDVLALDEALATPEAGFTGTRAFYARLMTQFSLPYTDQKDRNEFLRRNGDIEVRIWGPAGLPYGSIPRLLICWVSTEAVQKQDRAIYLGHSFNEWSGRLGFFDSGGPRGDLPRLRNQTRRLFRAHIDISDPRRPNVDRASPLSFVDNLNVIWSWDPKHDQQVALWDSTLTLSEAFFREITTRPVPVRLEDLSALRRSPLAIDLYVWLAHRMFSLERPAEISYEALRPQFGSDIPARQFRFQLIKRLQQVLTVYPAADVTIGKMSLILRPSATPVPALAQRQGGRRRLR